MFDRAQVLELRHAGRSWRQIAAALGIRTGTARTVFNTGVQKPLARETAGGGANQRVASGLRNQLVLPRSP
jgi:hypothetical protein